MAWCQCLWLSIRQGRCSTELPFRLMVICLSVSMSVRSFHWLPIHMDMFLSTRLIAYLSDQMTDQYLLQSDPAGWLADRTDRQSIWWMADRLNKYPDMPTIWIETHISKTEKSFSSDIAFHLQTTDKPLGEIKSPVVTEKAESATPAIRQGRRWQRYRLTEQTERRLTEHIAGCVYVETANQSKWQSRSQ